MTTLTLSDLGWSANFQSQLDLNEIGTLKPARVAGVHRDALDVLAPEPLRLVRRPGDEAVAVGDWVLADDAGRVARRLKPTTALKRRAAGTNAEEQLIAANVDTLGIVTSCNADFNVARIERYLVLASAAGCLPLVILTKADMSDEADAMRREAERLSPLVTAMALDARDASEVARLNSWCGPGQTIALVGSSGVGKTTLMNALTGAAQATAGIREDDAKGRHTTTARELHRLTAGGWIIDTPGMRALRLTDVAEGIGEVFDDIDTLARSCRFGDCEHETEPGCAVLAAVESGDLEARRLERWRKLVREDRRNSETIAEARSRERSFGKMIREVAAERKRRGKN